MKRTISLLLGIIMILSSFVFVANADTTDNRQIKSGDFYYEILKDGTARIIYYEGNDEVLVIPAEIDGRKVSAVDRFLMAIAYEKKVKEIIFEDGIKTISGATNCKNLKKVTIPKSVTRLEGSIFYGCESLNTVIGGENVISCKGAVFENTPFFKNKANRKNGQLYFGKCLIGLDKSYTGALKIRSDTTCFTWGIFNNAKNITSVNIPASVKYLNGIEYGINFWDCPKLEKITVAKGNKYLSSVDGILFNKKQTVLYRYPSAKKGKTYNVPKKVTQIAGVAFEGSKYLTAVNFDKNAETDIRNYSFLNCKSLKTMTIPKNSYIRDCPGMGLYVKEKSVIDYDELKFYNIKGFVLKAYAFNEVISEYTDTYHVKLVTLCKDGKAHKTKTVKAKSATYFSNGYKAYKRCTVCGEKIDYHVIEKKKLDEPKIKVTAGKGTIKVKYTAVKGATGFNVRYVDKNGKKVTKTFTTNKSKTVTISGVKKGQYYVTVRALVKSGKQVAYSSWTARSTVKVK